MRTSSLLRLMRNVRPASVSTTAAGSLRSTTGGALRGVRVLNANASAIAKAVPATAMVRRARRCQGVMQLWTTRDCRLQIADCCSDCADFVQIVVRVPEASGLQDASP